MEYPIISCYPHHANLVANVMTNDFDFDELSTNYIQVVYNQNINRSDFNYGIDILSYIKNYPYVDSYCYDRNVVKEKWKTYDSFVVDMIDKGCYVHMLIDTFYISAYSSWYKTSHKVHNITIYGYDETYFYVADNFKNGKYSFEKINRTEIDAAELDGEEYDWLDGVHCWRLKENVYLCIGIDTTMVKKMINEYLNHKKTGAFTKLEENRRGIYGRPFYYGIDVYDKIIDYVRNEEKYLDSRNLAVLIDQKRVLQYICHKLEKEYRLHNYKINIANLKTLEEQGILVQNMFIKYNLSNNRRIKDRIILQLSKVKQMERDYLGKLYKDIEKKAFFKKAKAFECEERISYCIDDFTQGEWKGEYGKKGYYIIGDKIVLPDNVEVYKNNSYYVSLKRNFADIRGLNRAENDFRLSAYYLNNNEFDIEIRTHNKIKVTLYIVDYDRLNRSEEIIVQSKEMSKLLLRYMADNFDKGRYLSFWINEDVIISFKRYSGPDAVLSGIFFD